MTDDGIFGELIYSYSRKQAIEDGILVDLNQKPTAEEPEALDLDSLCKQAGFKVPIAMTIAAFGKYVALSVAARRAGNDINGRLWDILNMLRYAICNKPNESQIIFEFRCVTERIRPSRCFLKAVIGGGDAGEPVITIMEVNED